MTIHEILIELRPYSIYLALTFILIPLISWGYGKAAGGERGAASPYKYGYTGLIYIASIPGILACVLTAYALLIDRVSLLSVNIVVYFLPIISMVATIIVIMRSVDLKRIPGLGRLYGLLLVIAITFFISLAIIKTRIWILFGSSIITLFIFAVVLFALLEIGISKLLGSRAKREDLGK